MEAELSLEQFASITAALELGRPRDEVLGGAGLSNDAWEAARTDWLTRLAAQAASGNIRSCARYTELLRAYKAALRSEAPRPPPKREGAVPVAPATRLVRLGGNGGVPVPRSAWAEPAPAFTPAAAAPPLAPPPPAPPPPAPPPPVAAAPPRKAKHPLAETNDFVSPIAVARPVTPFGREPAPAAKVSPARRALAETDDFVSPIAVARPALPFPKRDLPVAAPAPNRAPDRALPFKDPRPPTPSRSPESFTLAEYAKICATVRAFPDQVAEIRGHYGLDGEAWRALHALWRDRFAKDSALQARWNTLVERNLKTGGG